MAIHTVSFHLDIRRGRDLAAHRKWKTMVRELCCRCTYQTPLLKIFHVGEVFCCVALICVFKLVDFSGGDSMHRLVTHIHAFDCYHRQPSSLFGRYHLLHDDRIHIADLVPTASV